MTERLPPQTWMDAPATRAVVGALEAAGGPGCARFVGGCVRDALLGRPFDDVDIATPLTPPEVIAALGAAGVRAVPTGVDHGVVTAVSGGRPFEVATLRRDVETDGRRAVVAYTRSWAEDAARRDFRLNALYAEPGGALHDPTGGGLADARAGRVAFIGEPHARLREDYLRILRFFRFTAWYGREGFDAAGLAACAELRSGLARLSAERVSKELLRLLAAPDPRPAVRAMAETGVLTELLPEVDGLARFLHLVEVEVRGAEPDAVLRLAALLPDAAEPVRTASLRLKLSNAQRDRLAGAVSAGEPLRAGMDGAAFRRARYLLGARVLADRLALALAADPWNQERWAMLELEESGWSPPAFPVSGAEIAAAGVPQGPLHGRVRRELERLWVAWDFPEDAAGLRARLREMADEIAERQHVDGGRHGQGG